MKLNKIYNGDNLFYMKRIRSNSVDLIYADPPAFAYLIAKEVKRSIKYETKNYNK